mmetsp:Transcript_32823/g.68429  ORF Transcript_32823/g.68429 Transcript_32823/m.68429 type:complete len:92 (-) Transcript_32823:100-375(-)
MNLVPPIVLLLLNGAKPTSTGVRRPDEWMDDGSRQDLCEQSLQLTYSRLPFLMAEDGENTTPMMQATRVELEKNKQASYNTLLQRVLFQPC